MITKELIERINWLSRKQRSEGLTDDEKEEQSRLRQLYLKGIRSQVTTTLNNAGLKSKPKHKGECSCQHCKGH